jgi:BlaI family penicillinase repressor
MKALWDRGPSAARDVYAALPDANSWAYKTVKTLLSRLVAKGAVDYDQVGNSYLYRAVAARDDVTREEVRGLFSRIVGEAVSPVLAHFIEQADLTSDEIKQLKEQLDRKQADCQPPAGKPAAGKRRQPGRGKR